MSICKNRIVGIAFVKATILVILVGMLMFAFVGCSKNTYDEDLLGTWQYNQHTKYVFSADGSGFLCADDVEFTYQYITKGNTLKLDFTEDVVQDCEYIYSIQAGTLTLSGGEGTDHGVYQLTKVN